MKRPQFSRAVPYCAVAALWLLLCPAVASAAERETLDNGLFRAVFEDGALTRISDIASHGNVDITGDAAALTVDGQRLAVPGMKLAATQRGKNSIEFSYGSGEKHFTVVYELKPDWHFLSKQIRLVLPKDGKCRVNTAEVFSGEVKSPIGREYKASNSSGAVFLRLGGTAEAKKLGLFLVLQNPFLAWNRKDGHVSLAYLPEMDAAVLPPRPAPQFFWSPAPART